MSSITESQAQFAGVLAYACTIPGTILCFMDLVTYAVTAYNTKSRSQLDRVTFRLLTYGIIFNMLYGIAFSVTASQVAPGPLCTFGAFAVNLTVFFAASFTFCIALNLQLVLVHGLNGRNMEKYYLIGSFILSVILTVPAYGLHQFGFQEDNATCWFKNPNHEARLHWLIGSQSFWLLLIGTGETVCSAIVLCYLKYHKSRGDVRLRSQTTTTRSLTGRSTLDYTDRYRNLIVRIALYPLVSMIMNYTTSILDIYQTVHGLHTQLDFQLLVLDLVMYGLRPLAYGTLAIMDPSFILAFRTLRGSQSQIPMDNLTRAAARIHVNIDPALEDANDHLSGKLDGNQSYSELDFEDEDSWNFRRQL